MTNPVTKKILLIRRLQWYRDSYGETMWSMSNLIPPHCFWARGKMYCTLHSQAQRQDCIGIEFGRSTIKTRRPYTEFQFFEFLWNTSVLCILWISMEQREYVSGWGGKESTPCSSRMGVSGSTTDIYSIWWRAWIGGSINYLGRLLDNVDNGMQAVRGNL
jgi:hypothetical protein